MHQGYAQYKIEISLTTNVLIGKKQTNKQTIKQTNKQTSKETTTNKQTKK